DKPGFVVIDINASGDVHGRHQHHAFLNSTFLHDCFDLRSDMYVLAMLAGVELPPLWNRHPKVDGGSAMKSTDRPLTAESSVINPATRWAVATAGVIMQIALGAVYAWSVFRIPLTKTFGWTISQVTFTFTLAIFMLGFAAFVGGLWMRRSGPHVVAIAAGILYGAGVFLASLSGGHLYWLYFSYGFLGGIGLGLGYIVPVATLVKWFPDKRGMITGIAVAGFGAGAL